VLTCSALEKKGVDKVWNTVVEHNQKLLASGEMAKKRQQQSLDWLWSLVNEGLKERFNRHPRIRSTLSGTLKAVESGERAPTKAAEELLFFLDNPA
jgi:LAO/AO transport system kinase